MFWEKKPQWLDEELARNWYKQITAHPHNLPNSKAVVTEVLETTAFFFFFKTQIADLTLQAWATANPYKMCPQTACRPQIVRCWLYEAGHYKGQMKKCSVNLIWNYQETWYYILENLNIWCISTAYNFSFDYKPKIPFF